jgi:hypothetical protein
MAHTRRLIRTPNASSSEAGPSRAGRRTGLHRPSPHTSQDRLESRQHEFSPRGRLLSLTSLTSPMSPMSPALQTPHRPPSKPSFSQALPTRIPPCKHHIGTFGRNTKAPLTAHLGHRVIKLHVLLADLAAFLHRLGLLLEPVRLDGTWAYKSACS